MRCAGYATGWIGALLCLSACTASCAQSTIPSGDALTAGEWGGVGIIMDVGPNGATFDFGCDAGVVASRIALDASSHFSVAGTYSFGRGGPRSLTDLAVVAHPARFDGRLQGTILQLQVVVSDLSRTIGDFELQRGRRAVLERCS